MKQVKLTLRVGLLKCLRMSLNIQMRKENRLILLYLFDIFI
jgi:hypothetical protein